MFSIPPLLIQALIFGILKTMTTCFTSLLTPYFRLGRVVKSLWRLIILYDFTAKNLKKHNHFPETDLNDRLLGSALLGFFHDRDLVCHLPVMLS